MTEPPDDYDPPDETPGGFVYPPNYEKVKLWIHGKLSVNNSEIGITFNLRYTETTRLIHALQRTGEIEIEWSQELNGYRVRK